MTTNGRESSGRTPDELRRPDTRTLAQKMHAADMAVVNEHLGGPARPDSQEVKTFSADELKALCDLIRGDVSQRTNGEYVKLLEKIEASLNVAPRPEPVVAPLPSEARNELVHLLRQHTPIVRSDRPRHTTKCACDYPGRWGVWHLANVLLDAGYRLVPEDGDDTVRVPREAVETLRKVAADDPDSGRMTSFRALTYGRAVTDFLTALDGTP
ncbi:MULTISPECIES: hypothetical protein [unclassified Aeromicrobium]|uniref:hypothetical protein n=1 Tax=unclassified Aeromicrobium TaxID=2633570 RepID=UPI00288C4724|nr:MULTISPECIES: hypothetical protein [unclassified Aeromicrobium]